MFFSVFYGRRFYGRSPVCSTIRLLVNSRSCHFLRALRGSAGPNPLHSSLEAALRVRNGFAAPPIPRRINGCVDFKIIFFFFTNRGYCATIICVRANFEFYVCSRKIGSQRFLPRKKASALRLCRIFFGSKIASANFSAAHGKPKLYPETKYRGIYDKYFKKIFSYLEP